MRQYVIVDEGSLRHLTVYQKCHSQRTNTLDSIRGQSHWINIRYVGCGVGMVHGMQMWLKVIQGDNKENLDTIYAKSFEAFQELSKNHFSALTLIQFGKFRKFSFRTTSPSVRLRPWYSSRNSIDERLKRTNWNVLVNARETAISWCGLRFGYYIVVNENQLLFLWLPFRRVFCRFVLDQRESDMSVQRHSDRRGD